MASTYEFGEDIIKPIRRGMCKRTKINFCLHHKFSQGKFRHLGQENEK